MSLSVALPSFAANVHSGALDVVRLPVSRPTPHSREVLDARALGDFQYELWKDFEDSPTPMGCGPNGNFAQNHEAPSDGEFMLVHRPKHPTTPPMLSPNEYTAESSDEDSSFTLVHRPKTLPDTTSAGGPSPSKPPSPEWVAVSPGIIKAEPPADHADQNPFYDSGDDWSLL